VSENGNLYGWHFVANNRELAHSGEPLEPGRTYRVEPPIVPCQHGLHGSLRLIDALTYAPGAILTRCEYGGQIVHEKDKFAAETRRVLWIGDVTNILHEAACVFAEKALGRITSPDPRSVAAIAAKRAWLRGEITDKDLDAAGAAARAAVRATTWDAEWAATWAAAGAAARAAARATTWDATWDAARAAEWAAAWAATWDATWDAARAAEWAADAQNDWLECAVREMAGVDQ
jgi:hypothetical protein